MCMEAALIENIRYARFRARQHNRHKDNNLSICIRFTRTPPPMRIPYLSNDLQCDEIQFYHFSSIIIIIVMPWCVALHWTATRFLGAHEPVE